MRFEEITERALSLARQTGGPCTPQVREVLRLLADVPDGHDRSSREQGTPRQQGFIARIAGLGGEDKRNWYEAARHLHLTKRHLGHVIKRVNEGALEEEEREPGTSWAG